MSLVVVEPGPLSLVVDAGRPGWQSLGVARSGAADRAALIQGNGLVGNAIDAAAIEFALVGPTLRCDSDLGCVLTGAPFSASIGDRAIAPGVTFMLRAGATLKIGTPAIGMRGYLCVAGGMAGPVVLGSRSSLEPIRRGDRLVCSGTCRAGQSLAEPVVSHAPSRIRCIAGPQVDWFDRSQFFGPEFQVTPASNRMGLRLLGSPLTLPRRELVSEPVVPGAVQVLNDGQCVVLGVDGQTIGGYPKVAVVISADLDVLGQLRPGQVVSFECVSLDEAEHARAERERRIRSNLARLAVAIG